MQEFVLHCYSVFNPYNYPEWILLPPLFLFHIFVLHVGRSLFVVRTLSVETNIQAFTPVTRQVLFLLVDCLKRINLLYIIHHMWTSEKMWGYKWGGGGVERGGQNKMTELNCCYRAQKILNTIMPWHMGSNVCCRITPAYQILK